MTNKRLKSNLSGYLDDFNLIRVYFEKTYYEGQSDDYFLIVNKKNFFRLKWHKKVDLQSHFMYEFYCENVEFYNEYSLMISQGMVFPLQIGLVTKTKVFEKKFAYGGPLGAIYHHNYTDFNLYAPTAIDCYLAINDKFYKMTKTYYGFNIKMKGNYDGYLYNYLLKQNGSYFKITDPYGLSANANHEKSAVINLDKINVLANQNSCEHKTDMFIYELSVRDFTSSKTSYVKNKGKYLGLVEENKDTKKLNRSFSYLKNLGITHLQVMPCLDFGTINEMATSLNYNWGYDPISFFTLEGSYSTNPKNPYSRIEEFCHMVSTCHKNSLGVILDIVDNHVFDIDNSVLNITVPNYFFLVDDSGNYTNSSGCGNDFDSSKYMAKRMIVDQAKLFAKYYKIDGFRYDLMGLMTKEAIDEVVLQTKKINPLFTVYGEGWNINSNTSEIKATIDNAKLLPEVSFFNDVFRNTLVGEVNDINALGYFSNLNLYYRFVNVFLACTTEYDNKILFDNVKSSINYIECHDDYTLYDRLKSIYKNDEEKIMETAKLILSINILALGIPFIHAGEEFLSSKEGFRNTYNLGDNINQLNYDRKDKYHSLVNYLEDLIKLRKENEEFRWLDMNKIASYKFNRTSEGVLKFSLDSVIMCINVSSQDFNLSFDKAVQVLFNDKKVNALQKNIFLKKKTILIYRE